MSMRKHRTDAAPPERGAAGAHAHTAWVDRTIVLALACVVVFALTQLLPLRALQRAGLRAGLAQRRMEPVEWPDFRLLDADGRSVARADLAGTGWIADILSLQCTDCAPLSGRIADVQQRLRERSVRFVSFSIDRSTTAGALAQQRARHRRVDPARWTLLQSDAEHVPRLLVALGLADDLAHARARVCSMRPHFYLIDRRGELRGTYAADDARQLEWLASDADALASAADEPADPHLAPRGDHR